MRLLASLRGLIGRPSVLTRDCDAWLDIVEDRLIAADAGVSVAASIREELRRLLRGPEGRDPSNWESHLADQIRSRLPPTAQLLWGEGLQVAVLMGVNGAGKTTTLGKLAHRLKKEGRQVLVGACDTFRAAAAEQLELWCERSGTPIVRQDAGADAAAVAHDTLAAARARGFDTVLLDTAGRLQNREELMRELAKLFRVLERFDAGLPQHTWLVVDAHTGQNALQQARMFGQAHALTGLVVTKLDGSAKAGFLLGLRDVCPAGILFAGTGEGLDDLTPWDPASLAQGLGDDAN